MRLHSTAGFKSPVQANSAKQKPQKSTLISKSQTQFAGEANEDSVDTKAKRKHRRSIADEEVSVKDVPGWCLIAASIAALIAPKLAMPPLIAGVVTVIQDACAGKAKKKPDTGVNQP